MSDTAARIVENLHRVHEEIAVAAQRSGRSAESVRLVAVTKYVDIEAARQLLDAGCRELGESRPQELWAKAESLSADMVHWHLVGHLQRNKIRRTLPLVELIHSVDSERLLDSIDREAAAEGQRVAILLEVNISGDAAKHGFQPEALADVLSRLVQRRHVDVKGLMTMASLSGRRDAARRDFCALRELRDRLRGLCPPGVVLEELSMGMSGDFDVAIEEGATIVRVGSRLFEGIEK